MTCSRCTGLLVTEWNVEYYQYILKCILCGHYPMRTMPLDDETRGVEKKKVVATLHQCECGHAKVPWRSYCRGCLDRRMMYERRRIWKEKKRSRAELKRALA